MNATTKPATNAPTRTPVVAADIFGNTLTLNFPLTKEQPELQIDVTTLTEEIRLQAMLHGLKQKLCDAAAIARNTDSGLAASPDDKYLAVKAVYDRITSSTPSWNAIREGETRAPSNIFIRAVAEATGKDIATTQINVKAMTKEQQAALKKNIRIVDIMQRLEREEATKMGNAGDDLLALLAGDGMFQNDESGAAHMTDAVPAPIGKSTARDRRTGKGAK